MSSPAASNGTTSDPEGSPDKLFYKIGEVARITGLEPYVLRYWESEFPQIQPRKGQGGQRLYRLEDLEMVRTVQRMLHQDGFTIAGAKRQLGRGKSSAGTPASDAPEPAQVSPRDTAPAPDTTPALKKTREGLQGILELMDNTDSSRGTRPE